MSVLGRFVIDIEAKDSSSGHRAKARVHLWVYEPEQTIKLVVSRPPAEVHASYKAGILRELRDATRDLVALDDIRFHVDNDSLRRGEAGEVALHRDMTDVFVHVVDPDTNVILEPKEVLKKVDRSYDALSVYYEEVTRQHERDMQEHAASNSTATFFYETLRLESTA